MKNLRLRRKVFVLYRQVQWLYEDAGPRHKQSVLSLLRRVARLRRHVIWMDQWKPQEFIKILKAVYLPAITKMFQEQQCLAVMLSR